MRRSILRAAVAVTVTGGLAAASVGDARHEEARRGGRAALPAEWTQGGEVVDGLQLCLRPARPVYALGERVYVELYLRNTTAKPVTVLDMVHFNEQTLDVRDEQGNKAPGPIVRSDYFGPKPPRLKVRGGHFYGRTGCVSDFYFMDRTGHYTITAQHACSLSEKGYWQKKCTSNPLVVGIRPVSFAPRRADGWTLEMAGLAYENGRPVGIKFRIRSGRATGAFYLDGGFECFITRPDGVQHYWGGRAPGEHKGWRAFRPGEAYEFALSLLPRAREIFAKEGPYEFQVTYRNTTRSLNDVPVWRGQLASEKVRLRLPAPKEQRD